MTRYLNRARSLAGLLALIVGLTLVAPPAFAAAPAPAQPLAAAAAAKVEAMPAAALAQAAQAKPAAAPAETSKPFFKTGKGIAVLVLIAGGVGYAAYSAVHDRKPVKSPIR